MPVEQNTAQEYWDEYIGDGPDPDLNPNPTWSHKELKDHVLSAWEEGFEAGQRAAPKRAKAQ